MTHKIESPIACIRIPKSGSSSLMNMFESIEEKRRHYLGSRNNRETAISFFQKVRAIRATYKNNFSYSHKLFSKSVNQKIKETIMPGDIVVGGHFNFNYVVNHIAADAKLVTLMRHPVDRCVSEYLYLRKGYLKKPILTRWDAGISSRICGNLNFASYLQFLFDNKQIFGNTASYLVSWDGDEPIGSFVSKNVLCWGRLDKKSEFEDKISDLFRRTMKLPISNVTNSSTSIKPTREQVQLIEKIYNFDMEIFESI